MAGALRESPYPIATAPLTGFDVPWGSEVILEGVIESRKREIEGPYTAGPSVAVHRATCRKLRKRINQTYHQAVTNKQLPPVQADSRRCDAPVALRQTHHGGQ